MTETLQERRDPPAKNRVVGSRHFAANRVEQIEPQPLETVSETSVTITITVSGIPCWPSRDPIGERGGENLYGYVVNAPTVFVDRLGLAYGNPVPPSASAPYTPPPPTYRRSGGQAAFNPAKNVSLNGTIIGTVQIYSDSKREKWNVAQQAYAVEYSNGIWLEFHRAQGMSFSCLACNWLQFVKSRFFDPQGNEVVVTAPVAQGANVIQISGQRYLDSQAGSVWYPPSVGNPAELSIFDMPGGGINANRPKRVSDFDSFLICNVNNALKALFHATWRMTEVVGQPRAYNNITGSSIAQLPAWAAGGQWLRGYDAQGQPVYANNPLSSTP